MGGAVFLKFGGKGREPGVEILEVIGGVVEGLEEMRGLLVFEGGVGVVGLWRVAIGEGCGEVFDDISEGGELSEQVHFCLKW